MANRLNAASRRLRKHIDGIVEASGMDQQLISKFQDDEAQWLYLVRLRAVLVRGIVMEAYTNIDEALGSEIAAYFFHGVNFERMWKGEKFKHFNHYILERLSTHNKLSLVKKILSMPSSISGRIDAIIALRNEVGHFLFPENLRVHHGKPKDRALIPMVCPYKGIDVFTPPGVERLLEDVEQITWYFRSHGKVFRQRKSKDPNKNKMFSFV